MDNTNIFRTFAIRKYNKLEKNNYMTQEEKDLLLQDLCARLPYGVIVAYKNLENKEGCVKLGYGNIGYIAELGRGWWTVCKPYLRPISSMTNEDKAELNAITDEFGDNWFEATTPEERWKCCFLNSSNEIDWLNSHHFDYRGLIEKGLALEALEGMYN